ncbi:MAG: hypothetical protein ACREQM_17040 [Candidatus Dormibacteraceae bacterium]
MADRQEVWARLCAHPFLGGVRDGSLDAAAFRRWLAQDRLFVEGSLPFLGALLAGAPAAVRPLLLDALEGYRAELRRFDEAVTTLHVAQEPIALVTHAYLQYLLATAHRSWALGLVCLAVLERAYLESWQRVLEGLAQASPWRPLVEQWTTEPFVAYVSALAGAVDEFAVPRAERAELEEQVDLTIAYELAFWEMAWHGWGWPGDAR